MKILLALAMLYGPYIWCRFLGQSTTSWGLEWKLSRRSALETVFAAAATLIPLTIVRFLFFRYPLKVDFSALEFAGMAAGGLAAAVIEETFFRGFIQTILSRRLGAVISITATSAIFAVSHLPLQPDPLILSTFFPGLVMGLLRERHGSVFPAILYHGAGNLWAIWFFPL